jgi:hypothetical protein
LHWRSDAAKHRDRAVGWAPYRGYDKVGLLLERGEQYAAFHGAPLGALGCTDIAGQTLECNQDWALGGLTGEYDCLDAAASEIPCSGTGYATMPWISVFGEGMGRILEAPQMNDFKARKMNDVTITPGVPKALSPDATFFYIMPEVEIGRKDDGWYYRSLGGSSGYNRNLPKIGHFPTSREAARAAVADLALVDGDWINNLLLVVETSSMVGRAVAELIIAVCEDNPARAQVVQELTAALAATP